MLRRFTGRNYLFNKCFFWLPELKRFYLYVKSQTKSLPACKPKDIGTCIYVIERLKTLRV